MHLCMTCSRHLRLPLIAFKQGVGLLGREFDQHHKAASVWNAFILQVGCIMNLQTCAPLGTCAEAPSELGDRDHCMLSLEETARRPAQSPLPPPPPLLCLFDPECRWPQHAWAWGMPCSRGAPSMSASWMRLARSRCQHLWVPSCRLTASAWWGTPTSCHHSITSRAAREGRPGSVPLPLPLRGPPSSEPDCLSCFTGPTHPLLALPSMTSLYVFVLCVHGRPLLTRWLRIAHCLLQNKGDLIALSQQVHPTCQECPKRLVCIGLRRTAQYLSIMGSAQCFLMQLPMGSKPPPQHSPALLPTGTNYGDCIALHAAGLPGEGYLMRACRLQ